MGDRSPRPWLRSARRLWAQAVHLWHLLLAGDDGPSRPDRAAHASVPPPGPVTRTPPVPAETAPPPDVPPADATEVALLRAEIRRRERDVELLRAAMAEVLGRYAELARGTRPDPAAAWGEPRAAAAPPPTPETATPETATPETATPEAATPEPARRSARPTQPSPVPPSPVPPSPVPPAPAPRSSTPPSPAPPSPAPPSSRLAPPPAAPPASPDVTATGPVPYAPPPAVPSPTAPARPTPDELAAVAEVADGTAVVAGSAPGRNPFLSVVLVTSAWPATLAAAVDSVLSQDYDAWELLIVDDVRPVRPPPLLTTDGRVRVVTGPGRDPATAHDRGLDAIRGEFVTFLADDALMAPGWLRAIAWADDQWPGADAFTGSVLSVAAPPETGSAQALLELVGEGRARLVPSSVSGSPTHRPDTAGARLTAADGDPARLADRARRIPVIATVTVRDGSGAGAGPGRDTGAPSVDRSRTPAPAGPPTVEGHRVTGGGLPPLGGNGMLRAVDVTAARH